MSAPTPATRAVVYERDFERCASCGSYTQLEFQHRKAVGMGGSKQRPLFQNGLTSCTLCNWAYEHEMQLKALRFGWKVRNWPKLDPGRVPVYYWPERRWYLLQDNGKRKLIPDAVALRTMREIYGAEYDKFVE